MSKERKVSDETVVNLATSVVLQAEANYVNGLTRELEKAQNRSRHTRSEQLVEEIITEKRRLDPKKHIADEEEVLIYKLEHKCKPSKPPPDPPASP